MDMSLEIKISAHGMNLSSPLLASGGLGDLICLGSHRRLSIHQRTGENGRRSMAAHGSEEL